MLAQENGHSITNQQEMIEYLQMVDAQQLSSILNDQMGINKGILELDFLWVPVIERNILYIHCLLYYFDSIMR